jgi:hypothetical protein
MLLSGSMFLLNECSRLQELSFMKNFHLEREDTKFIPYKSPPVLPFSI